MSKKHQYIVSSRKGQTAVHRKARREVTQSLLITAPKAKPEKGPSRKRRRMERLAAAAERIDTEDGLKGKPTMMKTSLTQGLDLPVGRD